MKQNKIFTIATMAILALSSCNKESVIEGLQTVQSVKKIDQRISFKQVGSTPLKLNIDGEEVTLNCGNSFYTGTTGNRWVTTDSLRLTYLTGSFRNATSGFFVHKQADAISKFILGDIFPTNYPGFSGAVLTVAKKSIPFATNSFTSMPAGAILSGGVPFNTYNATPQYIMGTDAYVGFLYQTYTGTVVNKQLYGWIHVVINNNEIYFDNYSYSSKDGFKIGDLK
jgi:hypothetical protein